MTNICLTKHPDVLYSPVKLKDLQKMIKGQEELYMSNSTLEGKKKTENGVKRLIFSVLAILFQVGFMLMVFKRLNAYELKIEN